MVVIEELQSIVAPEDSNAWQFVSGFALGVGTVIAIGVLCGC